MCGCPEEDAQLPVIDANTLGHKKSTKVTYNHVLNARDSVMSVPAGVGNLSFQFVRRGTCCGWTLG